MALTMEKLEIPCANLFGCSVVPDVLSGKQIQNRTRFNLSEYDEIYEGFGQRKSAYPYRQQDVYERKLLERKVDALVLENDLMRAEFLPGLGGRLWRLYDKVHRRDLVYTNDCIRPSNLAIRNAWFSGGVEWNCGVIGHSPYTMDRIFASRLTYADTDVLRLYAYERIRRVVYQMDFWLDDQTPALNCHMSIFNQNAETIPMYWWSNIASPQYPGGRILVPAHKAYTYCQGSVSKVSIPDPEPGVDVSHYETIPSSRDYFFENDPGTARWIAHVDESGFGLLHSSGDRLQSRKLFVWGRKPGGKHWQRSLTEQAGEYLEIQAGLGKTQYGCIPMAPHTTWEWSERYEPIGLDDRQMALNFDEASRSIDTELQNRRTIPELDRMGHEMLKLPSEVLFRGNGDGAVENALRRKQGLPLLREYLDFSSPDRAVGPWKEFLKTGILEPPEDGFNPSWDPYGPGWLELLEQALENREKRNWYLYYCIGLLHKEADRQDLARRAVQKSLSLRQTACGEYLMAVMEYEAGRKKQACQHISAGLNLGRGELSYVRAALQVLYRCENWRTLIREIQLLSGEYQQDGRIRLLEAYALLHMGHPRQAADILESDLLVTDIREGEKNLSDLWRDIYGRDRPVPLCYDFEAT